MADTTALKNRIRAAIKANDNQEITGPVLQQALLDMVDELNGATETEASQRQSADNTLQQNINTEASQRQSADNTLQQNINTEASQRQSAEAQLNNLMTGVDTFQDGYLNKLLTGEDNYLLSWEYGFIDDSTGEPIAHDIGIRTSFIPTIKGIEVTITSISPVTGYFYVAKYDKNKQFISMGSAARSAIFSGINCAYVRVCAWSDSSSRDVLKENIQITSKTEQNINITAEKNRAEGAESTLQQNITAEKNRAEGAEAQLNNLMTGIDTFQDGYLNKLLTGEDNYLLSWEYGSIDDSTGEPIAHGSEIRTSFIPTIKGIEVTITSISPVTGYFYVAKYDKNKQFISMGSAARSAIFSGINCAYVRVCAWSDSSSRDVLKENIQITSKTEQNINIKDDQILNTYNNVESDNLLSKCLTEKYIKFLTWENGSISDSQGINIDGIYHRRTAGFIPLVEGININFNTYYDDIYVYYFLYDKNCSFISASSAAHSGIISKQNNACFVRLMVYTETSRDKAREYYVEFTLDNGTNTKNIFNTLIGGSVDDWGNITINPNDATHCISDDFIKVDGGQTYTLGFKKRDTALAVYIAQYSGYNTGFISIISRYNVSFDTSITLDNSCNYVRIMFYYMWESELWKDWCPTDVVLCKGVNLISFVRQRELTDNVDAEKLYERLQNSMVINKAIADFKIPSYYFDNLYLNNKLSLINNTIYNSDGNIDVFFFITDMHWHWNQKHSPALINYIACNTDIPMLVNCGDDADGRTSANSILRESVNGGAVYPVVGNHEYIGTDADGYVTRRLWKTPNVLSGKSNRGYYYYENPLTKTRFIVLSAYKDNGDGATIGYEAEQLSWFTNDALNVQSGWNIIIFTHSLYEENVDGTGQYLSQDFLNAIDNYSGNGFISFVLQGHAHWDNLYHTPSGIPIISTTCDKNEPWINSGVNEEPWLNDRLDGTIKEQAFDVMIVKHTSKELIQIRIGCPIRYGTVPQSWTENESLTISFARS